MAQQQQNYCQGRPRKRMYGKKSYRNVLPLHDLHNDSNVDDDDGGDGDKIGLFADAMELTDTAKEDSGRLKASGPACLMGGLDGPKDTRQSQRQSQRQRHRKRQSVTFANVYAEAVAAGADDISLADAAAEKLEGLMLGSVEDDNWSGEQDSKKVGDFSQRGLRDVVDGTKSKNMERLMKKEGDEKDGDGKSAELRLKLGPLKEKDGNIRIVPGNDEIGCGRKKGMKKATNMKNENDGERLLNIKEVRVMKVKGYENKISSPMQTEAITRSKLTSTPSNIQCKTRTQKPKIDVSEAQKERPPHVSTGRKARNDTVTAPPQQPEISLPIQSLPSPPSFLPDLVSHTTPLLALATDPSACNAPIPFCAWSDELSTYFDIIKIAEASYGEVYRLVLRKEEIPGVNKSKIKGGNEIAKMATGESVMKVIPLKAPTTESSMISLPPSSCSSASSDFMPSSAVTAVTSEVQLLRRMTTVPGFTNFRDVRVVYGRPGQAFIDAWRDFRNEKLWPKGEDSAFPDPGRIIDDAKGSSKRGKKKMENLERQKRQVEMQLWAVIEMEDAGVDLEGFDVVGVGSNTSIGDNVTTACPGGNNWGVFGVWDVFWNVATALAKGEREARFEHRDLHLGNICVRYSPFSSRDLSSCSIVGNLNRKLGFTGLETTIIDYTLSRADLNDMNDSAAEEQRAKLLRSESRTKALDTDTERQPDTSFDVAFLNLESDPALFEGDGSVDTQYDVYRYMRAALLTSDPLALVPPPSSPIRTSNDTKNGKSKKSTRGRRSRRNGTKENNNHNDDDIDDDDPDTNTVKQNETEESPWRAFHPQTNLIWLNFVLGRLMASLDDWQRTQRKEAKQQQQKELREARKKQAVQRKQARQKEHGELGKQGANNNDDIDNNNENCNSSTYTSTTSSSNMVRNEIGQQHLTDSKTKTETETETKQLDQRARLLTRILRKVQRALDLDALAVKSVTASTAATTRTRKSARKNEGSSSKGTGTGRHMGRSTVNTTTGHSSQASVRSTIELVGWAVAEGWLDLEDVVL